MLRELGLGTVAEQVYRTMLDEPDLDAGLLPERLGLSQADVSKALDELADLALLRMSRVDPDRRLPVSLDRGIALLVRRQEEELEARRRALAESRAAADAIAENATAGRHRLPAGVEHLTDLDEIQSRMESLVQSTKVGVWSIVPTVMPAAVLAAARPLEADLLAAGLVNKSLGPEKMRTDPDALAHAVWLAERGAQIRTAPVLPHRLCIVDGRTAVLPTDPEDPGQGAVLITTPGIVASLVELFNRIWETATPLQQEQITDEETGLTTTEQELLKILHAGLTDEAAAKRLGVSVRTVKRRMEDLMRRLDAGSRFQAGAKAQERGWL